MNDLIARTVRVRAKVCLTRDGWHISGSSDFGPVEWASLGTVAYITADILLPEAAEIAGVVEKKDG